MLTLMGKQSFNIEMQTAWSIIKICIQPIIVSGGETRKRNKTEVKQMSQLQENMMIPKSALTETFYMETGLIDIKTSIWKS